MQHMRPRLSLFQLIISSDVAALRHLRRVSPLELGAYFVFLSFDTKNQAGLSVLLLRGASPMGLLNAKLSIENFEACEAVSDAVC